MSGHAEQNNAGGECGGVQFSLSLGMFVCCCQIRTPSTTNLARTSKHSGSQIVLLLKTRWKSCWGSNAGTTSAPWLSSNSGSEVGADDTADIGSTNCDIKENGIKQFS